jgi:hypothetical protein
MTMLLASSIEVAGGALVVAAWIVVIWLVLRWIGVLPRRRQP